MAEGKLNWSASFFLIGIAPGQADAESRHDASADRSADRTDAVPVQRVTCASVALFPIESELECVPAPLLADRSAHATFEVGTGIERDEVVNSSALLGELVVTKDIEIPGLTGVGVRMIPSRNAVAGTSVPVVFIPRFVGTSWYGAQIIASF